MVLDYYPFGMLLPNRHESTKAYRYGFQGQEKDDEIAGEGNSYTAEFWQYDSRLGRRWNVDPIPKTHESPYAAFANNPIWFIDPNGADTSFTDSQARKDFTKALETTDQNIKKIETNIEHLETTLSNGKKANGKDLGKSAKKKLEKTINAEKENLAGWKKIESDFINIVESQTMFIYSSDVSALGKNFDGETEGVDWNGKTGKWDVVKVTTKGGRDDLVVHENRHANQRIELGGMDKSKLVREREGYSYQKVYNAEGVRKFINQAYNQKYKNTRQELRPPVGSFTLDKAIIELYNLK